MAKITIAGDVFIITSSKTLDQLKQLEKYFPKALVLEDENDKPYFAVGTGSGSINKNGISFNGATPDEHKLAYMKQDIPAGVADAKQYVADHVGTAFLNLQRVEARLGDALNEMEKAKEEVLKNITNINDPVRGAADADAESEQSTEDDNND